MKGNTDRPVELYGNDEFQIGPYVSGLAEFIEECETPMTIAVQGDWGCGKTSMMNMTRDYLKRKDTVIDVWFNTWQFSQFNADEQLTVTFLQHLLKELGKNIKDTVVKDNIVNKIAPVMKTITIGMTKHFVGSDAGDMVNELLAKAKLDMVEEVSELKQNFQELITKVTNNGQKRVVVFIDDLDRLQPVRAVELLEILKLFVDCDNCIFVMAIDTSVVFQGICEKYGTDMTDEKTQSFFDKMIQLPFKMPVAYYKLDDMIKRLLTFLQDQDMTEDVKQEYVKIIRKVTNGNPRSIKRLSNSILLLEKVAQKKGIYNDKEGELFILTRRIIVLLNCIQMRYEGIYNFLVNDLNYKRMHDIIDMKMPDKSGNQYGENLLEQLKKIGMSDIKLEDSNSFYDIFSSYVGTVKKVFNLYNDMSTSTVAINKVIEIISLGNIISESDGGVIMPAANSVPVSQQTVKNDDTECEDKAYYERLMCEEKYQEVYNMLVADNVYIPAYHVIKDPELRKKEYRGCFVDIKQCPLFKQMDEILKQYYVSVEAEIDKFKGVLERVSYKVQISDYTIFYVNLSYDSEQRYLIVHCNGCKFVPTMGGFAKVQKIVEEVKKEYRTLQNKYGNIVRDMDIEGLKEKRDEDGRVIEIEIGRCIIANMKMAASFIELFTYIAEHKELMKDTAPAQHLFGSSGWSLMDAAKASDTSLKRF